MSSHLLQQAAQRANRYLEGLETRAVAPTAEAFARLAELDHDFADEPMDPGAVLALLDDVGSPATVASTGPRYFGFVIGGSLPAGLAAAGWPRPGTRTGFHSSTRLLLDGFTALKLGVPRSIAASGEWALLRVAC